jgi:hypothetical protein
VSTRRIVTAVVIVFIGFFAFLTAYTVIEHGIDILTLTSLAVLILFAIGILGALGQPPDE